MDSAQLEAMRTANEFYCRERFVKEQEDLVRLEKQRLTLRRWGMFSDARDRTEPEPEATPHNQLQAAIAAMEQHIRAAELTLDKLRTEAAQHEKVAEGTDSEATTARCTHIKTQVDSLDAPLKSLEYHLDVLNGGCSSPDGVGGVGEQTRPVMVKSAAKRY